MMRTIPHRELRNRSSEILRDVQSGESYQITNHGEVVAVLLPVDSKQDHGGLRMRPASPGDGFTVPTIERDHAMQEVLDDLRGDR